MLIDERVVVLNLKAEFGWCQLGYILMVIAVARYLLSIKSHLLGLLPSERLLVGILGWMLHPCAYQAKSAFDA